MVAGGYLLLLAILLRGLSRGSSISTHILSVALAHQRTTAEARCFGWGTSLVADGCVWRWRCFNPVGSQVLHTTCQRHCAQQMYGQLPQIIRSGFCVVCLPPASGECVVLAG